MRPKTSGHEDIRAPKGEAHWRAKLDEAAVKVIRLRASAGEQHRELASVFDVSETTIHKVVLRKSWKHVA